MSQQQNGGQNNNINIPNDAKAPTKYTKPTYVKNNPRGNSRLDKKMM